MSNWRYESWGRYPKAQQQTVRMLWRHESLPLEGFEGKTFLPFGNGRSYGDVCLNDGGVLIDARPLDRFIYFDTENGVLHCEAGVLLSEILELIVPEGWFLPVTPGTQFVTVGGAIANDVHGKNHHRAGTFGCHVRCFELLRSDGSRIPCSPNENAEYYRATIGGLGLTGLITWAGIQLKPINSPYIVQEVIRYRDLEEFVQLSLESDKNFEYTAAWVDCLAKRKNLGRGLFIRGKHAVDTALVVSKSSIPRLPFPMDPPISLINRWSLKAFNTLYYHKQWHRIQTKVVHYRHFFYPLDAINNWNRLYGPNGFLQYQCVVPHQKGERAIREILQRTAQSGAGSFLAVLKVFGDRPSPGLLSFPKPGITLALDFPNHGKKTLELLDGMDQVMRAAGGSVYPAKDARMGTKAFKTYYPNWIELEPLIDPYFSSSFWRRVMGAEE